MFKSLTYSLSALLLVMITLLVYFLYIFNKAPDSLIGIDPDDTISAGELYREFDKNEAAANEKFTDKIIVVRGCLTDLTEHEDGSISMLLKEEEDLGGINCSFGVEQSEIKNYVDIGDTVNVKGICTGMLMDVALTKCVLIIND